MRILVYSLSFPPTEIGGAKYTGEMVAWLENRGHDVRVVTAPPFYPAWRIPEEYAGLQYRSESWQGADVWRCPIWVPRHPTGWKRLLHLVSFALTSIPMLLKQLPWKPNVVWLMVPTLFCAPSAWLCARACGARTWLHIQDFEVEAAFHTGLLRRRVLVELALRVERWLLHRFDRISTISRNMLNRVVEKGLPKNRCVFFPNWVDLDAVYPLSTPSGFRSQLHLPADVCVALYAGNMGEKQGLEYIVEVASRLEQDKSLHFILCGEGAARSRLMERSRALQNVTWLPIQPVERLNELLNAADIHLLPQRADVADLVMPSKLTGMLASGRPVIATALPGTQIHEVVSQCGLVVPPEDANALQIAVQALARDTQERRRLGQLARKYAEDYMSADRILPAFERKLLELA